MNFSPKTINIAHILSGDGIWGVENYVHNLVSSPNASAVRPLILCSSKGAISQKFASSKIDVAIVPIRGYLDVVAMLALARLFEERHIDLVHVHLGLDSFVGTIAAKLVNKPVVMSVHFDQPNYMKYSSPARQTWNACQVLKDSSIAHFLPITQNVALALMRREAVSEDKITVIHPGIPLFECDQSIRDRLRSELNASKQDVVVVGVGRLEPEKNFGCLVSAIALIDNKDRIKVWLVGDGSQRKELEESIVRLGLANNIQLLGYRTDVKDLLASADMFVLPSKAEPFGMSAVEAMMAKLPVVGTLGPGLGTIVQSEVTGLLVPPDDASALAKAINRLAQDPNLRRELGDAGRERAALNFNSDKMAQTIVSIYQNVLAGTKRTLVSP